MFNNNLLNHLTDTIEKVAKAEEREKWESFEIINGMCTGYFFEFPCPMFQEIDPDDFISDLETNSEVYINHTHYGSFNITLKGGKVYINEQTQDQGHTSTHIILSKQLAYTIFRAAYAYTQPR